MREICTLNPFCIGGGGVNAPPSWNFFHNSKSIKDIYFIFLTFDKMELSIFCQKIKVIGLTLAFLRPFLWLDSKNPKIENAILWGKKG